MLLSAFEQVKFSFLKAWTDSVSCAQTLPSPPILDVLQNMAVI